MGGKLAFSIIFLSLVVVHGNFEDPKEWYQKARLAKEKVTKLKFYFHDTVSGKNPTSMRVAQSSITDKSPSLFGLISMIDDPLTLGPEPNSKLVGRAQGLYAAASQEELALLMAMNFAFTDGKYNGSTLTVVGRNPIAHASREMPIVGGTGVFRLARGIATATTYIFNTTTADAIVEYNVLVIHY